MPEKAKPTREEVLSYLKNRRNWGRWKENGSAGAINLITPDKRLAALKMPTKGRSISLSRPWNVDPSFENQRPAQQYMTQTSRDPDGGIAMDYYGIFYHGQATTHIDALCHMWDEDGMWDGKNPDEIVTYSGAKYGSVDAWREGILTRGVLLDIPKLRGEPYVTRENPVHGWELEDAAKNEGITLEPGDAILVYSGREAYARDHDGMWMESDGRAGLHASCLPFVRDNDVSILLWDMMDAAPNEYDVPFTMHAVLYCYGVALVDNTLLEPLSKVCQEEGTYSFLLTINPLFVVGGTGSPVNPIAVF